MTTLETAARRAVKQAGAANGHGQPEVAVNAPATIHDLQPPKYPRTFVRLLKDVAVGALESSGAKAGAIMEQIRAESRGKGIHAVDFFGKRITLLAGEFEIADVRGAPLEYVSPVRSMTRSGEPLAETDIFDVLGEHADGTIDVRGPAGKTILLELGDFAAVFPDDNDSPLDTNAPPRSAGQEAKPAAAEAAGPAKKQKQSPPETAAAASLFAGLAVERVRVDLFQRHPENRRPKPADVAARAKSMQADGQLEPILARAINPAGAPLEILSGETRWLAARQLGWETLAARVIPWGCSDARALELLAIANAQRADLDPIEKARMIEQLCKPQAEGGAAMTREQAAKIYGFESGAGASNLVRLLKLPQVWQERVASGELPESFARLLTEYVEVPGIMAGFEKRWLAAHKPKAPEHQRNQWESRSAVEELIDGVVSDCTRTLDAKNKGSHYYDRGDDRRLAGWQYSGHFPRLFDLTDDVRKTLGIVTLKIDGKPTEVATNLKAYDKLQVPAILEHVDAKRNKEASRSADRSERSAGKPKKLTPAQLKAAAKLKADQLKRRIEGWRHAWLKNLCADALDWEATLHFMCTLLLVNANNVNNRLVGCFQRAMEKTGVRLPPYGCELDQAWRAIAKLPAGTGWQNTIPIGDALCALLVDEDRDRLRPLLPFGLVDGLAEELCVDVAAAWVALQREPKKPRLEEFLSLHTGEQLDDVAEELGVHVEPGKPKSVKVSVILAVDRTLPLPKSIKPLAEAGKKRRAKSPAKKGKRGRK